MYCEIGILIIEDEQGEKAKAGYGKAVLKNLAWQLTIEFGKGFEERIDHLQQFLMELGKGFAFVARQQHIVTDTSDFFIDLVFYNYYLKCFVLIDLKTEKLTHAAIGQIHMYVRIYLPKKEELVQLIERDRIIFELDELAE